MKVLKYIVPLLGLTVFMSCGNYKVLKAEKVLVIPGTKRATPYHRYELCLEVKAKSCVFKKIVSSGGLEVSTFSVKDATGVVYGNNKEFPKGVYRLFFSNKKNLVEAEQEVMKVYLETKSGKEQVVKAPVKTTERIMR